MADMVATVADTADTEEGGADATEANAPPTLSQPLQPILSQPLTPKPTGDIMEDTEVDMDGEDVDMEDMEVDLEVDSTDAEDIGDKINGLFIFTQISANNLISNEIFSLDGLNVRVTHFLEKW